MGQYLAADNAATLLAASVTNSPSVTSLILQDASKFPVVNHGGAGSDWSYVTLYDSANNIETVKLTRRDSGSNTLTIVRGTAAGISGITDVSCLAWSSGTTGAAVRLITQVVLDISAQAAAAALAAAQAASSASAAASAAASATSSAAASVPTAQKGAASGVASLDANSKVNEVAKSADVAAKMASTNWTVEEASSVLYFKSGGTAKAKLDASGNFTVTGNVTAYGTGL